MQNVVAISTNVTKCLCFSKLGAVTCPHVSDATGLPGLRGLRQAFGCVAFTCLPT